MSICRHGFSVSPHSYIRFESESRNLYNLLMLDRDTSRPPKEGFLTDRPDLLSFVDRISLPRRTGMNPKHGIDRMWLSTVTSDWSTFREAAIDWLATRP